MGAVYKQLSITERRKIERWRHAKVPVDEMARVLKRCRSTIFRELKRNYFSDESMPKYAGYYGAAAQLLETIFVSCQQCFALSEIQRKFLLSQLENLSRLI